MKQIRLTQEELNSILLREKLIELIEGEEVIFNIIIEKNGDVIFNMINDIETRLLNLPLTDVGLSKKTTRPLWMAKITTLKIVIEHTESELLRVLNFGPIAMKELKLFLIQNGMQLKEE